MRITKCAVIGGATDAEVVLFSNDLPVAGQLRWLPALHKAVVGTGKLTINELQSLSCRQRQVEKQ